MHHTSRCQFAEYGHSDGSSVCDQAATVSSMPQQSKLGTVGGGGGSMPQRPFTLLSPYFVREGLVVVAIGCISAQVVVKKSILWCYAVGALPESV